MGRNRLHSREELFEIRKEEFLKQAREKFGDRFDYDLSNFRGRGSIIKITEKSTGVIFETAVRNHLRSKTGIADSKFVGSHKTITEEDFLKKIEEIFPGQFEFLSPYITFNEKITVRCKIHNEVFETLAKNLYRGHNNCPRCYSELCSRTRGTQVVDWEDKKNIEKLRSLLVDQGKSFLEIGKEFNISGHQAGVIAKRFGIEKPNPIQEKIDKIRDFILNDKLTAQEIATRLGCTHADICGIIKKYKLPSAPRKKIERFGDKIIEKVKKLIEKGFRNDQIAEKLGYAVSTLQKALRDNNIKNPNRKPKPRPGTFGQKNISRIKKYIAKGLSNYEISEKFGCRVSKIQTALREFKLSNPNKRSSSISKGELFVGKFLKTSKIEFITQQIYRDVLDGTLVFADFTFSYNEASYWIEYNGQQHYEEIKLFARKRPFEDQLKRDEAVRNYCKENNIILIEVPYTLNTYEKVSEFLEKTIIQGVDPNTLIDYSKLYKTQNKI